MIVVEPAVLADPLKWLIELDRLGPARALPEYPWPSVVLMHLPMRLGIPTIVHYYAVVILFMLAADAITAWLLWRAGGNRASLGWLAWVLFVPALGPVVFTRFDIVPASLMAAALLAVTSARAASSAAFAGLGAGFKLWPAAALPALLVPFDRRQRLQALAGFVGIGAVLTVASAAAAGWERVWSPLTAQAERGLQLEAFAALPLLWARYFDARGSWTVRYAECKCHEIFGPGMEPALQVASFVLVLGAIGLVALHWRAFAAAPARRNAGTAALLTALLVIVWLMGGRVFSPQYMIWLAAPLAVAGVVKDRQLTRANAALFVVASAFTHAVFPWGYEALINEPDARQAAVLIAMTLRDALIVILAAKLAMRAWRVTSP